ncbi:MAG: TolC family protein [Gammaproteobacteria bacterium]|nr:TolC family protein [Gammaproteobacteria bacterium]
MRSLTRLRLTPILWLALTFSPQLQATTPTDLVDLLTNLLTENEEIIAANAAVEAESLRAKAALGKWYPNLDLTLNSGSQNNHADDGSVATSESKLKLTQLLWDFGATNTALEISRLRLQEQELALQKLQQRLILDGATAVIKLNRAAKLLNFSQQSEENIRRQTGLEEIRVSGGMGFSTDLLQSQAQLAAAKARRLQNEGDYALAANRYYELFGITADLKLQTADPALPPLLAKLPPQLADAITLGLDQNQELRLAHLADKRLELEVHRTRANELLPIIDLSLEESQRYNDAGISGSDKHETIAKIELRLPFNLGLAGVRTVDAAVADAFAQRQSTLTQAKAVERQIRDAWLQLEVSQSRAESLLLQSEISAAFLELARRERELGNRSLLDVLSGETALINARSDAEAAQIDTLLAALNLLNALAMLQLELLQ